MILFNEAFLPSGFNEDKIIAITVISMDGDVENGFHYNLAVWLEGELQIAVSCDQKAYDRNWKIIQSEFGNNTGSGILDNVVANNTGSGILDNVVGETNDGSDFDTAIHHTAISNSG